jgi:hypothetical protein
MDNFQDRHDLAVLKEKFEQQTKTVAKLEEKLSEIEQMINRWKGGFIVIAVLGGIIGWVTTSWDHILTILTKAH